jgi:hypothetical protein
MDKSIKETKHPPASLLPKPNNLPSLFNGLKDHGYNNSWVYRIVVRIQ